MSPNRHSANRLLSFARPRKAGRPAHPSVKPDFPTRVPRTISPLARRLTSLSAGLLLALALAESVLRLAGPSLAAPRLPLKYDVAAIDRLASGQSYLTFDADLGWRPTPDVDLLFELTHFVQNHDGLRAN